MRKIFIITIIFCITLFGANYVVKNILLDPTLVVAHDKTLVDSGALLEKNVAPVETFQDAVDEKEVENKIALLRNRFSLKGLITNGDTYLENQQLTLALKSYLEAKEQNPQDKSVIKKIGDTYFEMKKFSIANTNYKALLGSDSFKDDKRLILSYIYAINIKEGEPLETQTLFSEIDDYKLAELDSFFYKTSLDCINSLDLCLEEFERSISVQGAHKKNEDIKNIASSLDSFEGLQIEEDAAYLKKTYLLGTLFKAKLYPIVIEAGERILDEKPGYLPIIEMIAKSHFELGHFDKSKKYLLEYNEVNNLDPEINYMLGVVNIKLHEYILSNIYFIKAKKAGFTPVSMIYRRLIYNYYLVDNTEKMMEEFVNLINSQEDLSSIDYSLGIYYSLIYENKLQANKWINEALKLYPDDDNFHGYKGWVYKEAGDIDSALKSFTKGYSLNQHNPLINLNLGIIEAARGNTLKAKIYLKNTIGEDPNGQFGEAANTELAKIQVQEERNQKKIEEDLQQKFNQQEQ